MPARVHVVSCQDYGQPALREAVWEALESVRAGECVGAGTKVLLKPNLINSMPPERAVCTHPAVVRAVAEWALQRGAEVVVADQPGYALTDDAEACFRGTGLVGALGDLPVELRLLARGGYETVALGPHHRLAEVVFANDVLAADVVVNLPKAKTHSQTLFSGAVKNMFGAVAPKQRLAIHLLGRFWALSEAIADCYSARVPELHLMDAVVAMEGLGPTQGRPVQTGFLAASSDGVALDAVTEALLGFEPGAVATTVAAAGLELGERNLESIEVTGASRSAARRVIQQSPVVRADLMGPLVRLVGSLVRAQPKVRADLCRACGACAGICPAGVISVDRVATIAHEACVECFCCLEACPYDAIVVQRSPLYEIAWAAKRWLDRRAAAKER